MKLLVLLWLWLFFLFVPMSFGNWYDEGPFNLYQSAVSLTLILAVLGCYRTAWAKSFSCVCLLQIVLNTHDALAGTPVDTYNAVQMVLNTLEFIILFFIGTAAELGATIERGRSDHYSDPRRSRYR